MRITDTNSHSISTVCGDFKPSDLFMLEFAFKLLLLLLLFHFEIDFQIDFQTLSD